tara:strand:- start:6742 stop:6885 length:144 start_codon:yes stop_codon:yes gene_type:complete
MILVNKDGTKVDVHETKVKYLKSKGWKEEAELDSKQKSSSQPKSEKE